MTVNTIKFCDEIHQSAKLWCISYNIFISDYHDQYEKELHMKKSDLCYLAMYQKK